MRQLFGMTLLLLLIALPAAAQASRPAKPVEVRAISQAVVAFVKGDFPKSTHFRIFAVRVSTVDSHYAAARVSPLNKTDQPLTDTAFVALHRVGTHWSVVDLGTDGVGCTRLPAKVEHDLFALFFPECRHH